MHNRVVLASVSGLLCFRINTLFVCISSRDNRVIISGVAVRGDDGDNTLQSCGAFVSQNSL